MNKLQAITNFILTDTRGILSLVAIIDILTGILKAIKLKQLSSEISKWGTVTHTMIVMGFSLGYSMCRAFNVQQFFDPFMWVMIFTYLLSILENMGEMGAPLPNSLINIVSVLKDMNEQKIEQVDTVVKTEKFDTKTSTSDNEKEVL